MLSKLDRGINWYAMTTQSGPRVVFVNPKGLVAAASSTSKMSTSRASAKTFISLTKAIFTARWAFSSVFAISATFSELVGTNSSITLAYRDKPVDKQASVDPATNFGIVCVVKSVRPGVLALWRIY